MNKTTDKNKQISELLTAVEKLKDENERLKKEVETWKNLKPIDITKFCQTVDISFDKNNNYRKVLEEIREIIRFPLYTNSTKPLSEIDFLINLVNAFEKNREKIINKINEVLDER